MIPEHQQQALDTFYQDHGVGETIEHKFKFWKSRHPNGYLITHNPTPEQSVAIFELTWLIDNFVEEQELH